MTKPASSRLRRASITRSCCDGVGRVFAQSLAGEVVEPDEKERAIGLRRAARRSWRLRRLDQRFEGVDPLRHGHLAIDAPPSLKCAGERLDLGHGSDRSGQLVVEPGGQRLERVLVARDDEVVRRRLQGCPHDRLAVDHEPEPLFGVRLWMIAQRAGDAEHEVVARFVREQERGGLLEEVRGVGDRPNLHVRIVRPQCLLSQRGRRDCTRAARGRAPGAARGPARPPSRTRTRAPGGTRHCARARRRTSRNRARRCCVQAPECVAAVEITPLAPPTSRSARSA